MARQSIWPGPCAFVVATTTSTGGLKLVVLSTNGISFLSEISSLVWRIPDEMVVHPYQQSCNLHVDDALTGALGWSILSHMFRSRVCHVEPFPTKCLSLLNILNCCHKVIFIYSVSFHQLFTILYMVAGPYVYQHFKDTGLRVFQNVLNDGTIAHWKNSAHTVALLSAYCSKYGSCAM